MQYVEQWKRGDGKSEGKNRKNVGHDKLRSYQRFLIGCGVWWPEA